MLQDLHDGYHLKILSRYDSNPSIAKILLLIWRKIPQSGGCCDSSNMSPAETRSFKLTKSWYHKMERPNSELIYLGKWASSRPLYCTKVDKTSAPVMYQGTSNALPRRPEAQRALLSWPSPEHTSTLGNKWGIIIILIYGGWPIDDQSQKNQFS